MVYTYVYLKIYNIDCLLNINFHLTNHYSKYITSINWQAIVQIN